MNSCATFTINALTIANQNVKDYMDTALDFTDPGNSVATAGLCGTRTFALLDADNSDTVISGHAFIALTTKDSTT